MSAKFFASVQKDLKKRWLSAAPWSEIEWVLQTSIREKDLSDSAKNNFEIKCMDMLLDLFKRKIDAAYEKDRDIWSVFDKYEHTLPFYKSEEVLEYVLQIKKMDFVTLPLVHIAENAQSVHISDIEDWTKRSIEKLVSFTVPPGQRTLDEIFTEWTTNWPHKQQFVLQPKCFHEWYKFITEDMTQFAKVHETYRLALRGALAKIKTYDTTIRATLFERLWEEMKDSVGYCFGGRMSRIVNVFAGIDEDFSTDVPVTEKVANAFSALANMSVSLSKKIDHGKKILQEFGVKDDSWLRALEESAE